VSELSLSIPSELVEEIATRVAELMEASANGNGGPRVWLDAGELADHLGVCEKTIHNRSRPNVENPIPFHTLTPGGRKMFQREEVDDWRRRH
jgi:hypothetical protein